MYTPFYNGSRINEIGGNVYGGLTLLMDSAEDLFALRALCTECKNLDSVYKQLQKYESWFINFKENRGRYEQPTALVLDNILKKKPDDLSDVQQLSFVLYLVEDMWKIMPETDRKYMRIIASVGPSGTELIYEAKEPALIFHQGSLVATITPYISRIASFFIGVGSFFVGILCHMGMPASIHAEKLVEELRETANLTARHKDLLRLDKLDSKDIKNKKGIIILLHGLFSTDIGTFDGFIEQWNKPPDCTIKSMLHPEVNYRNTFSKKLENYIIVGWPHDTLTSINTNADMLFEIICSKFSENCPPIVFVCHSRGGLLARKTAVIMQEKGGNWTDKIKLCVTFGTPHKGADLAVLPHRFVGVFFAIMKGSKSILSASRVLAYYKQLRCFKGIEDLQPATTHGAFLCQLVREERDLSPSNLSRKLDILPIGSTYEGTKHHLKKFITGILGTEDHDLVIRKASSIPESFSTREETHCAHGEYFSPEETTKQHFRDVIIRIRKTLKDEDEINNTIDPPELDPVW